MKRYHLPLTICLGLAVFFMSIVAGGVHDRCLAAQTAGGQNYFEIWYYGVTENSPDVQMLENALYAEADFLGLSIDHLSLVNKGTSIINDLNNGTNTYGFDVTGPAAAGNGMYGYFSDPTKAYILGQDTGTGITTYLFGLVWVEDGDGVPASTEDLVTDPTGAGTGDGNGDGVPDRYESNATSLQGAGGAYVTIANTDNLTQTNVHAVNPPGDAPSNVTFPYGMFSFDINGLQNGGTAHMRIYVPGNSAINGYWKKNRLTGQWENIATSITTTGNKTVISFNLTDGGPYDEDGSVNGAINDQGGPGITGGTTATATTAVPAMNQWGAAMLACLMGIGAILAFRRKTFDI